MATQDIPWKTIGVRSPTITYQYRTSIRLIISSPTTHQIFLIQVPNDAYYKLPGGGVEGNESYHETGVREALEETGCIITMDEKPFAMTTEWRNKACGKVQCQISYCYRAELVGDTGKRDLTEEEEKDGFVSLWVRLEEARKLVGDCVPKTEFGRFVQERERWFLEIYV